MVVGIGGVLAVGGDSRGTGLVINASRSVLYAGEGSDPADFAGAAADAARAVRDEIRKLQFEFAPDRAVV